MTIAILIFLISLLSEFIIGTSFSIKHNLEGVRIVAKTIVITVIVAILSILCFGIAELAIIINTLMNGGF